MSRKRWDQFPQAYVAILRHFQEHAEEVWIEGADSAELSVDYKRFLKVLAASEDDEARRLAAVARELVVDTPDDGTFVVRMNSVALALRAPQQREVEEEITYYEDVEAFDPNALEEIMKRRQGDG